MFLSRRRLLRLIGSTAAGGFAGLPIVGVSGTHAQARQWRHGLSLFGELKYPPDFRHFDYVNPAAPKGGRLRLYGVGSFDSLNPYSYKGESSAVAANNEALMTPSLDEPSTEYGLVAEAVSPAEDHSSAVYRLRPEARFHDGKPITPEDVAWSLLTLRETHPRYSAYYKNVIKVEQTGEREVTFLFSEKGNRELPQIVSQVPVLPKHWWTGSDASGKPRDLTATTLEIPLGSGAYRCVGFKPGQSVTVRRVEDYWGRDLPVNVGQDNFDEITWEYFLDRDVAFEAFKADRYDFRIENTAKTWATQYNFPAVQRGHVVKEEIRTKNAEAMQCFAFNGRRPKFQDPRVRLAFNYAFDFEWTNANLFYSAYTRTASFFANSELAATGLPSAEEIAVLSEFRSEIPPEVFTSEFKNPVNMNARQRRDNLRRASLLFSEAGWTVQPDGQRNVLKSARGEIFTAEFLIDEPSFERIVIPYTQDLKKLGVDAIVRTIDSAQMTRRTQGYDYDIIWTGWAQSLSPGNEQREYWGSEAADRPGAMNYAGIKNKAIDKLIERLIYATSRSDLVTVTRALDRVLLWNHYVMPMWHVPHERVARWDRFGRPAKLPDYSIGFPNIWWWDEEKARRLTQS
jgi:microcin C transport system substrate-binding protein